VLSRGLIHDDIDKILSRKRGGVDHTLPRASGVSYSLATYDDLMISFRNLGISSKKASQELGKEGKVKKRLQSVVKL